MTITASTLIDHFPTTEEARGFHPEGRDWDPAMVRRIADWAEDPDEVDADLVFGDNPVDRILVAWDASGVRPNGGTPVQGFKDYVAHVIAYKRWRLTRWPNEGQQVGHGTSFTVGQAVRYAVGSQSFDGEVVTASSPASVLLWTPGDDGWNPFPGSVDTNFTSRMFDVGTRRGGTFWWCEPWLVTPLVPESGSEPALVVESETVVQLREQLAAAVANERAAVDRYEALREQRDAVMGYFAEQAEDRNWCTEWEQALGWVSRKVGWDVSEYRRERSAYLDGVDIYTVRVSRRLEVSGTDLVDNDGEMDADAPRRYFEIDEGHESSIQLAIQDALSDDSTVTSVRVDFQEMDEDSYGGYLR